MNKELSELKNLFEKLVFYELFESESLERLYQHFNSFSLPEPVHDHSTPLKWLGTNSSWVHLFRRLRGTDWIDFTNKDLEQNHFVTKYGKPLKIHKRRVDPEAKDVTLIEDLLKKYL